jgi:hypothetical protein
LFMVVPPGRSGSSMNPHRSRHHAFRSNAAQRRKLAPQTGTGVARPVSARRSAIDLLPRSYGLAQVSTNGLWRTNSAGNYGAVCLASPGGVAKSRPRAGQEQDGSLEMSNTDTTFSTVRRGYDPAQVQSTLRRMTEQMQSLSDQVQSLGTEIEQARQERDAAIQERDSAGAASYQQTFTRVSELMMVLDREVERIRGVAEAEGEDILAHARSDAYQIRAEAEEMHEAAMLARNDAERSIEEVTARRDEVLADLRSTFTKFLGTVASMAASIDSGELSQDADGGSDESPIVLHEVMPERPA